MLQMYEGDYSRTALLTWLFSFLFVLIIIGAIFTSIERRLADVDVGEIPIIGGILEIFGFGLESVPVTADTPLGTIVETVGRTEVWSEPGGADAGAASLGFQLEGAKGKLVEGPVEIDGVEWWFVDFEEDPDGWVRGEDLEVSPDNPKEGDLIETLGEVGVWGGPSKDSEYFGVQPPGALGTIIGGPVYAEGKLWYEVDFEEGPDGWVCADDIAKAPGKFGRFWREAKPWLKKLSVALSLLFIAGIVYVLVRLQQISKEENDKYKTPGKSAFVVSEAEEQEKDMRWQRVVDLVESDEPANWKLAILEADSMLDNMVKGFGLPGETLGERLNATEISDFATLPKAWEAHKVRNVIAHEGGDFLITQREARRVIGLYEEVFNEFEFI